MYFEITKFIKGHQKAYVTYSHRTESWHIMGDIRIGGYKFRMMAVKDLIDAGFRQKERVSYVGQ